MKHEMKHKQMCHLMNEKQGKQKNTRERLNSLGNSMNETERDRKFMDK
jgi:hypothetical protein